MDKKTVRGTTITKSRVRESVPRGMAPPDVQALLQLNDMVIEMLAMPQASLKPVKVKELTTEHDNFCTLDAHPELSWVGYSEHGASGSKFTLPVHNLPAKGELFADVPGYDNLVGKNETFTVLFDFIRWICGGFGRGSQDYAVVASACGTYMPGDPKQGADVNTHLRALVRIREGSGYALTFNIPKMFRSKGEGIIPASRSGSVAVDVKTTKDWKEGGMVAHGSEQKVSYRSVTEKDGVREVDAPRDFKATATKDADGNRNGYGPLVEQDPKDNYEAAGIAASGFMLSNQVPDFTLSRIYPDGSQLDLSKSKLADIIKGFMKGISTIVQGWNAFITNFKKGPQVGWGFKGVGSPGTELEFAL